MLRKLATKIFVFLGIIYMPSISAASYTHFLSYTNIDNDGLAQLEGVVTFNDQHANAQRSYSHLLAYCGFDLDDPDWEITTAENPMPQ